MKQSECIDLLTQNLSSSVLSEKKILEGMNHPFIVRMPAAFQDSKNLYMVLELAIGGERTLSEDLLDSECRLCDEKMHVQPI